MSSHSVPFTKSRTSADPTRVGELIRTRFTSPSLDDDLPRDQDHQDPDQAEDCPLVLEVEPVDAIPAALGLRGALGPVDGDPGIRGHAPAARLGTELSIDSAIEARACDSISAQTWSS